MNSNLQSKRQREGIIFALALFFFAGAPPRAWAEGAAYSTLIPKMQTILKNQDEIIKLLDTVKQEMAVVKIRISLKSRV